MKVKVGIDPDGDVARVSAVRDAVGPQVHLGVDANGGWAHRRRASPSSSACASSTSTSPSSPSPPPTSSAWRVRRASRAPGRRRRKLLHARGRAAPLQAEPPTSSRIYVGKAGGIGPAREIAPSPTRVRLSCTIGSNLELGIGSARDDRTSPWRRRGIDRRDLPCDIIGPLFYEDDILVEPLPIKAGERACTTTPGLGVELDEAKVARYRVT